jgi:hypothetical protein
MIEPRDHLVHGLDRRRIGRLGPAQHDDFDVERARCGDLTVGRDPAAVLGDHRINGMCAHQRAVIGGAERAAVGDIAHTRQRQRRFDRIDAADQIEMLRRRGQRRQFAAAERDKDVARVLAQSRHGIGNIDRVNPTIPGNRAPWRPPKCNQRHARLARGRDGIGRNDIRIRVRRVDESVDPFLAKILGKTGSAAEAAGSNRHRLRRRRLSAAGERHNDFKIGAFGQARGQFPRLRRAAEDKDA